MLEAKIARVLCFPRALLLASACLFARSTAFSSYQSKIPNGQNVARNGQSWPGVGHEARNGGGARNAFGAAFAAEGRSWTTTLCQADSDSDGETNGAELGDPNCVWTESATPAEGGTRSHPGYSDSTMAGGSGGGGGGATQATVTTTVATVATQPTPGGGGGGGSGCTASTLSRVAGGTDLYDCSATVGGGIDLHWFVVGNSMMDLAITRTMAAGYMALAFPGQDAVVMTGPGFIVEASGTYGRYTLTAGSVSATSDNTVPFVASSTDATVENGQVIFRITGADMSSFDLNAVVPMIWANKDSNGVSYHDVRGGFRVNFLTGESSVVSIEDVEDERKLHGILQITAWAFLAPMAVFIKRLGARWPAFQKIKVPLIGLPLPYVLHADLMLLCIILSLSGTAIAKDKFTTHPAHGHETFAILVTVLAVIQPFPALIWQCCKPAPDSENFKRAKLGFGIFHRLAGISAMVFAYCAIFTGIQNYRDLGDEEQADSFTGAAVAGMVVLLGCWLLVEIVGRVCSAKKQERVQPQEAADSKVQN
mmetsp:Transcript_38274/g.89890  ORF Transcript_38274/g.89890 Transcript_38274/m.89890 type:complete len:537 (-) Transcript_38274:109-1719(-)